MCEWHNVCKGPGMADSQSKAVVYFVSTTWVFASLSAFQGSPLSFHTQVLIIIQWPQLPNQRHRNPQYLQGLWRCLCFSCCHLTLLPWLVSPCIVVPLGHCPTQDTLALCLVGCHRRSGLWKEDAASRVQPTTCTSTSATTALPS